MLDGVSSLPPTVSKNFKCDITTYRSFSAAHAPPQSPIFRIFNFRCASGGIITIYYNVIYIYYVK